MHKLSIEFIMITPLCCDKNQTRTGLRYQVLNRSLTFFRHIIWVSVTCVRRSFLDERMGSLTAGIATLVIARVSAPVTWKHRAIGGVQTMSPTCLSSPGWKDAEILRRRR